MLHCQLTDHAGPNVIALHPARRMHGQPQDAEYERSDYYLLKKDIHGKHHS